MALTCASISCAVAPFLNAERWLVAYSGGIDSHVLLHSLLSVDRHPPIVAVHVNHQLQAQANDWAQHCLQQAQALGVEMEIINVDIRSKPPQSLEQQAREARYQVFESRLGAGDVLMMGHHQDDQAETLLLRLLRGSGGHGAAAIPEHRSIAKGQLLRPLIHVSRAEIEAYAKLHILNWVEDPSNHQLHVDRNFLRHEVLPILSQRWPQYRQTLSRAAQHSREASALNTELAALDFAELDISGRDNSLSISALKSLSLIRQKNVLRYWLQRQGFTMPSAAQLQALRDDVIDARQDAVPLLAWADVEVRRFARRLYAMAPLAPIDPSAVYQWDLSQPLSIAAAGCLHAQASDELDLALDSRKLTQPLSVRFRGTGERCQPVGRVASQSLKKLLQEYAVPTWLRERIPLVFCGDDLVAVADLWVCEGWQSQAENQGIRLQWSPLTEK